MVFPKTGEIIVFFGLPLGEADSIEVYTLSLHPTSFEKSAMKLRYNPSTHSFKVLFFLFFDNISKCAIYCIFNRTDLLDLSNPVSEILISEIMQLILAVNIVSILVISFPPLFSKICQ